MTLNTKEALWKSSLEEQHLSSLVSFSLQPLAPATSLSTYKERGLQTNERLDFSTVLRQLQVVTQAKSQLEQELLHEQCEQNARKCELIAREISKI